LIGLQLLKISGQLLKRLSQCEEENRLRGTIGSATSDRR